MNNFNRPIQPMRHGRPVLPASGRSPKGFVLWRRYVYLESSIVVIAQARRAPRPNR